MNLADVLRRLEERLLDPAVRGAADAVADLLADDFVEFGSSGRVFDKRQVIASLQGEEPRQRSLSDFRAVLLAAGVALVTYRVHAIDASGTSTASLRSSIWRREGERWRVIFHQGTPTAVE